MSYWVGRIILGTVGWKAVGELPDDCPRAVFIAAPHTSNWDLVLMLACAFVLGVPLSWVGKHSMFEVPLLGRFLLALRGVPVIRHKGLNQVDQMSAAITGSERMYLALAPSGTRGKKDHWKSGFYHVAIAANVPIICGHLDYKTKSGGIGPIIAPSGDIKADMEKFRAFYGPLEGKKNENKTDIRLRDEVPEATKPA
ncbi:MAG: 1-acyl-sn-glycerol-3-phosphate acyltransferase [Myxococcota bacterium]|jgi:1-acyl-sn-glycerol-3-phosphate acyltransferase